MVNALRRAHELVADDGYVVNILPSEAPALVLVGDVVIGGVESRDASVRHAAAGEALTKAVDIGLFKIEADVYFDFRTYADSIDELRDHISATWKNARIDERVVDTANAVLRSAPRGVRPYTLERVRLTTLRPIG